MIRCRNRFRRRGEFLQAVHDWTTKRTSEEVLEQAGKFRIPAGPVLNGEILDNGAPSERPPFCGSVAGGWMALSGQAPIARPSAPLPSSTSEPAYAVRSTRALPAPSACVACSWKSEKWYGKVRSDNAATSLSA